VEQKFISRRNELNNLTPDYSVNVTLHNLTGWWDCCNNLIVPGHILATGGHIGKFVPLVYGDHFDTLSELQQRALKEARKYKLQPCNCTIINNDEVDKFRERKRLKWFPDGDDKHLLHNNTEWPEMMSDYKEFKKFNLKNVESRATITTTTTTNVSTERKVNQKIFEDMYQQLESMGYGDKLKIERAVHILEARSRNLPTYTRMPLNAICNNFDENAEDIYLKKELTCNIENKKDSAWCSYSQEDSWNQESQTLPDFNNSDYQSNNFQVWEYDEHCCPFVESDCICQYNEDASKKIIKNLHNVSDGVCECALRRNGKKQMYLKYRDVVPPLVNCGRKILDARYGAGNNFNSVKDKVIAKMNETWMPNNRYLGDPAPSRHKKLKILVMDENEWTESTEEQKEAIIKYHVEQVHKKAALRYKPSNLLNEVRLARIFQSNRVQCPECYKTDWGYCGGSRSSGSSSGGGAWCDIVCRYCAGTDSPTYFEVKTRSDVNFIHEGGSYGHLMSQRKAGVKHYVCQIPFHGGDVVMRKIKVSYIL